METKPFIFYSDKIKAKSDGENYYVSGYISTGDLDLVNDVVTKSCLDSMINQFDDKSIKLDFEHEAFRGKDMFESERAKTRIPLGKAINRTRDEKGVKVEWELNSNWKKFDEKGNVVMDFKDIWNNIEQGYYDAFSIAYLPTETKVMERDGKSVRLLDSLNLLNVALTGNPVNPSATMTSVMAKSLEFMEQKENEELEKNELLEIKSQVEAMNDELKTIKAKLESDSMEEETKSPEAEQTKSQEAPEQTQAPVENEQKSEPVEGKDNASEQAEQKSGDSEVKSMLTELKSQIESLKSDLGTMKKENEELKSVVESARVKSVGQPNKEKEAEAKSETDSSKGPLDMI